MQILHDLCSIPTAPFVESRVYDYVRAFARDRKGLRISKDQFGNHLLELRGRLRKPRIVFVAHTDHPGFVARKMIDEGFLDADFRGGVLSEFVSGAKVRFFDGDREITGVVVGTSPSKERSNYPARTRVRVQKIVAPGSAGVFDQGKSRIRAGKFYSRVCDDLAGAAAALSMLDELHVARRPLQATVAVLLTRAEEVGFIGALAAVLEPRLLRPDDLIISIECSALQPYAPQGNGVIIRVGDRTSVFDSSLTYFLTQQAEQLARSDRRFKYQRQLMPGGSCEGTVFDAYGFTTAAACVALGNYHNMDRVAGRIGPEYVAVNDWKHMVQLFVRCARHAHEFEPQMRPLKHRLEAGFNKLRRHLES